MTVLKVTSRSSSSYSLYSSPHQQCKIYLFTRIMLAISIVSVTYIVVSCTLFNLPHHLVVSEATAHQQANQLMQNGASGATSSVSRASSLVLSSGRESKETDNDDNLDTNIVTSGKLTSSSSSLLLKNNATRSTRINGQVNTLRKHSCKWPSLTACFDADTH